MNREKIAVVVRESEPMIGLHRIAELATMFRDCGRVIARHRPSTLQLRSPGWHR